MARELPKALLDPDWWDDIQPWDMPSFHSKHTLHDAEFGQLIVSPGRGPLLTFQWDLHWNRMAPAEHDLLVLYLRRAYSVRWTEGGWEQGTVSISTSELVSELERTQLLESEVFESRAYQGLDFETQPPMFDDTLTRTVVSLMNFGRIQLLHSGDVRLVCVDRGENTLPLPYSDPAT